MKINIKNIEQYFMNLGLELGLNFGDYYYSYLGHRSNSNNHIMHFNCNQKGLLDKIKKDMLDNFNISFFKDSKELDIRKWKNEEEFDYQYYLHIKELN